MFPVTRAIDAEERRREGEREREKKKRRREELYLGNSIKGVREFSAKPERFCGRILSRGRRPRQNPGFHITYLYYICVVHVSMDRPPPLPLCLFPHTYVCMWPGRTRVYVYQYYISRNIGWTSRFLSYPSYFEHETFRYENRAPFLSSVSCLFSMDPRIDFHIVFINLVSYVHIFSFSFRIHQVQLYNVA